MIQTLKNQFWHLPKSIFFSLINGRPSKKLTLIGVTGTDGKTTTSSLIYHVLKEAGYNAGVITTIGAKYGNNIEIGTGLHTTSPDPSVLQKILKDMVKNGVTHVVCEVTAHALDQHRYFGCHFKSCVITNTSHEHLDYYKNMSEYIESKSKLFNQTDVSILNKDDSSYKIISKTTSAPILTYSIDGKSDFQAKNIKINSKYLQFDINGLKIKTNSPYRYQIYNILAAFCVCSTLQIKQDIFQKAIQEFPETKGRREEVSNNLKIKTIVDFAHTPAALKVTLESLKETTKGNLIVLFGATGGRDPSKRPMMGKIATEIADITILTSDDTRMEKVEDINKQIAAGINTKKIKYINYKEINTTNDFVKLIKLVSEKHIYLDIGNRQDAFNFAIKLSKAGDTVIACGKGHETTILHGSTEYPWSETEAFRTAFRFKET